MLALGTLGVAGWSAQKLHSNSQLLIDLPQMNKQNAKVNPAITSVCLSGISTEG